MILIPRARPPTIPVLEMAVGQVTTEGLNLTPYLIDRETTITSVSWASDSGDLTISGASSTSYKASATFTAVGENSGVLVTATVTMPNSKTDKFYIRVRIIDQA